MTAHVRGIALALVVAAWAAAGCGGGSKGAGTRPAADLGGDVPGLIALADSAIARGDANEARRALDRALSVSPGNPAVHLARGRFYAAIRRYADAKTEFERAASLDPTSPEPHYQLGKAYLAAGERDEALASFNRATALDPAHGGSVAGIASLLGARYEAAGIPGDYPRIAERSTLSRGELGVALAVELGANPDGIVWRSDEATRMEFAELDDAWGARWVRAAIARRWLLPYADGALHLEDPVTRASLAITLARIAERSAAVGAPSDSVGGAPVRGGAASFPDLGPRHYLGRAAERAVRFGLPTREGGKFEPLAVASGLEALRAVRGLARSIGASPVVSPGP